MRSYVILAATLLAACGGSAEATDDTSRTVPETTEEATTGGEDESARTDVRVVEGTANLAWEGTATQSSTWAADTAGADASNAIDHNRYATWVGGEGNSISHTESEDGAWWEVDLGAEHTLTHVVVFNREDQPERMNGWALIVRDAAGEETARVERADTYPDPEERIDLPDGTRGQHVRVQLLGANYLHIAEVEVFGE